jgi:hypothetical protein
MAHRVIGGTCKERLGDNPRPSCTNLANSIVLYQCTAHVAGSDNVMDFLKSCWTNLQAVVSAPLTQGLGMRGLMSRF